MSVLTSCRSTAKLPSTDVCPCCGQVRPRQGVNLELRNDLGASTDRVILIGFDLGSVPSNAGIAHSVTTVTYVLSASAQTAWAIAFAPAQ
jgi:hypothetical protein